MIDTETPQTTGPDPSPPATPRGVRGRIAALTVIGVLAGVGYAQFTRPVPVEITEPVASRGLSEQVAALERRVAADPGDLPGLQQLASLYVRRAASTGDPAFYVLADRALEQAEDLRANDPSTTLARANLALARHEFARALDLGQQVLAAVPGNASALGVIVDAEVELGRYTAAAETLQRMLDAKPGLPALARASYLRELYGDVDGAILAMQQAITAGAGAAYDVAVVTTLLGDLHLHHGDLGAAREAYGSALDLVPDLPAAITGRARWAAASGDLETALATLVELTDRIPYPDALLLLEGLQLHTGDPDAAATARVIDAVTTLQEEAGQVVELELAIQLADRGDGSRAVAAARRTYEARPTVYAASALAWALTTTGDAAAALPYVEESLELGTRDALLHYRAAYAFDAAGDTDRAATHLRSAIAIDPEFTWRYRTDALALATRLRVDAPASWSRT